MKRIFQIIFLSALSFITSCTEDIGENWKTFEGELIYSYLDNRPEQYSKFTEVLNRAGLKGMLNAYGSYTCLAPTNKAMQIHYNSLGINFTIDSLRQGQIDTLAKGHIVSNRYHTNDLSNGVISSFNMNSHYVDVQYDTITGGIRLNGESRIISKDNDVYNGVVHGIGKVLSISIAQLPNLLKMNKDISIFTEALFLTRLSDSLIHLVDPKYSSECPPWGLSYSQLIRMPLQRKYGYTAFVEDNNVLKANGINNLADLVQRAKELYPSSGEYDDDFTHRKNSLNQYLAYHLVEKAIYKNKLFYTRNAVQGYTPDEFFETMLPYRIIRASRVYGQTVLNANSKHTAQIIEANHQSALNGVYHLLDDMLVYTEDVEQMLQNTRIRFDVASLSPELTNNNIRGFNGKPLGFTGSNMFGLKQGYQKNIMISGYTKMIYETGTEVYGPLRAFQGDQILADGPYDLTIRLLPVPPGTYELRYGYRATSVDIYQIYVDNKPIGTPLLRENLKWLGYILDSETDDNSIKSDQILRNNGYMKAPNTFMVNNNTARNDLNFGRKIVGTFSFTDYQPHTLRFRSVDETRAKFSIDYIEFVPKSVYDPPGDGVYETRD